MFKNIFNKMEKNDKPAQHNQSELIELLEQRCSSLLKYMDCIDGTFGCRDRYENSIALDADTGKINAAALVGHYVMLCDQAISLILPATLDGIRAHRP
jgi:hypothetical protein